MNTLDSPKAKHDIKLHVWALCALERNPIPAGDIDGATEALRKLYRAEDQDGHDVRASLKSDLITTRGLAKLMSEVTPEQGRIVTDSFGGIKPDVRKEILNPATRKALGN